MTVSYFCVTAHCPYFSDVVTEAQRGERLPMVKQETRHHATHCGHRAQPTSVLTPLPAAGRDDVLRTGGWFLHACADSECEPEEGSRLQPGCGVCGQRKRPAVGRAGHSGRNPQIDAETDVQGG